ncbi:MAG: amino acid ABC transporter permease [Anaerovorax sp.]
MDIYLTALKMAYSGLEVTLKITFGAVVIGVVLGLIVALCKMSRFKALRYPLSVYVELLRGTPLIVQALILYAGVPSMLQAYGIDFNWSDREILAAIIACGVNSSAYVAEIIRSGLQSVDIGQREAARSLGMNGVQAMIFVVIPQGFRIVLPALANEFIALLKETAVLSVIAIVEVTRSSMLWASTTYQYWPAYLGTAVVYLSITIPLSRIVAYMERRMAQSDRGK